jgi:hypothetical protein
MLHNIYASYLLRKERILPASLDERPLLIHKDDNNRFIVIIPGFPALFQSVLITDFSSEGQRLSENHLTDHNANHQRIEGLREKQTTKRFREEDDSYCRFLVTGESVHQQKAQAKRDLS